MPFDSSAMPPCSRIGQRGEAADQAVAVRLRQFAISVVGEGDASVGIAQHDQVALRFEQAAGALLGFLQFPVPIRHRLIVQGDLAQFFAHQPKPDTEGRECNAGEGKQETDAERERLGIVAGDFRPACGNKAIGAAKRGGEDDERANGETDPGMTTAEAAKVQLDPESPPHRQLP